MDSMLLVKYYIYDVFGKEIVTDSREEALASLDEGREVYESHETTWRIRPRTSGKNIVFHELRKPNEGGN